MIPTSNHNFNMIVLYIPQLYIFWFLHQTTTIPPSDGNQWCCISFDSYIKPQPTRYSLSIGPVVYLLIPTSNHNLTPLITVSSTLYIFWFLHQTTTQVFILKKLHGCISFDSYIKPQLFSNSLVMVASCISFDSYIKPQLLVLIKRFIRVVYLLIPTSNHNL